MKLFFQTDSTCVLAHISNPERRFKMLLVNMIALICQTTQPSQWKYEDTQLKVTRDLTRGLSAEARINNTRCKKGPDFLWKTEEHWPQQLLLDVKLD